MRTRLECNVTACRHNEHNLCDLPGIKIEGPGACESRQTCCESFEPRSGSSNSNSTGSCGCASSETSIDCKAQNCTYNHDCKCEAECVCVGCSCGESAGSVSGKSGTECCTFREG